MWYSVKRNCITGTTHVFGLTLLASEVTWEFHIMCTVSGWGLPSVRIAQRRNERTIYIKLKECPNWSGSLGQTLILQMISLAELPCHHNYSLLTCINQGLLNSSKNKTWRIQLKFDAAVYLEQPSVLGHLKAEPCGKAQWLSRECLVLLPWWPYLHVCVFVCSGCATVKRQYRTPQTDWSKSKTYHIKSLHPDPLVSSQTQSTF